MLIKLCHLLTPGRGEHLSNMMLLGQEGTAWGCKLPRSSLGVQELRGVRIIANVSINKSLLEGTVLGTLCVLTNLVLKMAI